MNIDKYTNEIHGMKGTQFMSAEDNNGNTHILIQDGKFTDKGNEIFGFPNEYFQRLSPKHIEKLYKQIEDAILSNFHRTFPIDPNAPKV